MENKAENYRGLQNNVIKWENAVLIYFDLALNPETLANTKEDY